MGTFLRSTVAVFLVLVGFGATYAQSPAAKGRPADKKAEDTEPVPGYKYREINGFRLLVHNTVLEEDKRSTQRRKPMEVLALELDAIERELPPRAVAVLRTIPIWVEWRTGDGKAVAVYRSGNKPGKRYRFDSLEHAVKSNCVEIVRMDALTGEHQGDKHRSVLLHEFTHAVHHHLFDYDNPIIKAAYANARSKGLYEGKYAATNAMEYFAELSCAYFGHLNYPPANREELKKYDSTGYRMMELIWGTPEEIEKAQKPERESRAILELGAARRLLRDRKRKQEGVDGMRAVIEKYPDTRAAREAKKVLEKSESGKGR